MDNHNALEQAWLNGYKQGRQAVEKCGPIDVAVVVRCKDCKYAGVSDRAKARYYEGVLNRGFPICVCGLRQYHNEIVPLDGFCSYGERKNDGE